MAVVSLDKLVPGETGRIRKVSGRGAIRRRLVDMGLTPGVPIEMIKVSPLGDPIEYRIRGYYLTLRKSEAETIEVELVRGAGPSWGRWHGQRMGHPRRWQTDQGALPLVRCRSGQQGVITQTRGGRRFTASLNELGLVPGAKINVVGNDLPGPLIVALEDESRITLGRRVAWHILIKPT
jgi:ferrous iron transport protein A